MLVIHDCLTHHPIWRDFLSNCTAQIMGGLVSSVVIMWFIERHDRA